MYFNARRGGSDWCFCDLFSAVACLSCMLPLLACQGTSTSFLLTCRAAGSLPTLVAAPNSGSEPKLIILTYFTALCSPPCLAVGETV